MIERPYRLYLSERELADLLGAMMALKQLVGECPPDDSLDRLIEQLQDTFYKAPAK